MVYGEVIRLPIQDRLDAERFSPISGAPEGVAGSTDRESFRMLGLFGEIPGSSCEPIHVEHWTSRE
jgi:hypothetical protein